jgi:putative MATE family efflux protein
MVNSLTTGVFLAIILAVLGVLFSSEFLKAMMVLMEEVDNNVLNQGSIYLKIVSASMIFGLPMMIINAVLQGIGDMKTPLYINVCNTVFNYLLIFGIGFFPELGVAGAALGTALSRVLGTVSGFRVLVEGKADMKLNLDRNNLKLESDIIKDIFDIGAPATIEQLVRQSSQIVYILLVAGLGTNTIAANAIVMNTQMVPIMIGFGFSTAATTLVGQSLGADKKDLAKRYGRETAYISMLLMIMSSVPMFIWVDTIIGLFTNNPDVISLVKPVLRIMILIQAIFGIMMVLTGALRGTGDIKWRMYIAVIELVDKAGFKSSIRIFTWLWLIRILAGDGNRCLSKNRIDYLAI